MKTKISVLLIVVGLFLAACAPAAAVPIEPAVSELPTKDAAAPAPTTEAAPAAAPTEAVKAVEVSFSKDIWPIIEKFAVPAHGGRGGVFLESYNDIMKYVVPGKPEESVMMDALNGTNGHPVMPPGNPFPKETIQLFYDWILQGAKNN